MSEIQCKRCSGSGEGPGFVPPGKNQKYIQENICKDCWEEWKKMSVKVINENRLTPFMPQHKEILEEQMKQFLNLPN